MHELAEPAYVRGTRIFGYELWPLHQEVLTETNSGGRDQYFAGEREGVHAAERFDKADLDMLQAAQAECPRGHDDWYAGARPVARHQRRAFTHDKEERTKESMEGGWYGSPVRLSDLWLQGAKVSKRVGRIPEACATIHKRLR